MKQLICVFVIGLCCVAVGGSVALADQASHRRAAEKLLDATNVKERSDQVKEQVKGYLRNTLQNQFKDVPRDGQEMADALVNETMKWVSDDFSWEETRGMYVDIYAQVFTEEEIEGLLRFYQSPIGQKMLQKTPELTQLILQKTQARIQKKIPDLEKSVQSIIGKVNTKQKNVK